MKLKDKVKLVMMDCRWEYFEQNAHKGFTVGAVYDVCGVFGDICTLQSDDSTYRYHFPKEWLEVVDNSVCRGRIHTSDKHKGWRQRKALILET